MPTPTSPDESPADPAVVDAAPDDVPAPPAASKPPGPPLTLLAFARAMDAAAATPAKLEKQRVLAELFRDSSESDVRLAIRYAAGRPFGWTDERVLAVGGALVWSVILRLVPVSADQLRTHSIESGELGEALSKIWHKRERQRSAVRTQRSESNAPADTIDHGQWTIDEEPPAAPHRAIRSAIRDPQSAIPAALTLQDLAISFDHLAATGRQEYKRSILYDLFAQCDDAREATYLAKIISGDLRTGVQEGVLQAAIAQAFGKDLAAVQRCQLLAGDLDQVALLARADQLACATFALFHPIQFMLATPQETPDDAAKTLAGRAFLAEDKLDGIRAQIHKLGDQVAIYTRTMDRADDAFPEVVAAMARLPHDFLIDGEIVPVAVAASHGGSPSHRIAGASPASSQQPTTAPQDSALGTQDSRPRPAIPSVSAFAHLQRRLGRKKPTPAILEKYPVQIVAFDLLYLDGFLLMDLPLAQRRHHLERLAAALPEAHLAITAAAYVTAAEQIAAEFDAAKARRNEGLILKDPASVYSPGRRGKMWLKDKPDGHHPAGEVRETSAGKGRPLFSGWLKLKAHLPTLDCVVTAAEFGHGKRRGKLSDYTFAVWDRDPAEPGAQLLNIGKAYSGVTDAEIEQFTLLFQQIATRNNGHTFWVKPQVVLEIAFDQIQRSKRHASGFALRFPRIKTIRWDKPVSQADTLARAVEIHGSDMNTSRDAVTEPAPEKKQRKGKKPPPPPEPTLFDGLDL